MSHLVMNGALVVMLVTIIYFVKLVESTKKENQLLKSFSITPLPNDNDGSKRWMYDSGVTSVIFDTVQWNNHDVLLACKGQIRARVCVRSEFILKTASYIESFGVPSQRVES